MANRKEIERKISEIWTINRSCLSKSNLTEAEANRIVDLHFVEGNLMYYYKCAICSSFHLTSREPLEELDIKVI